MNIILAILKMLGCVFIGFLRMIAIALFCLISYPLMIITCLASIGGYDEPYDKLTSVGMKIWDFLTDI